jgi:hypothetical protein
MADESTDVAPDSGSRHLGAIPVLVWIWTGPTDPMLRTAVSASYVVFFLLAPRSVRGREPERHLLPEQHHRPARCCHLRQHRWQKIATLTRVRSARELTQDHASGLLTRTARIAR